MSMIAQHAPTPAGSSPEERAVAAEHASVPSTFFAWHVGEMPLHAASRIRSLAQSHPFAALSLMPDGDACMPDGVIESVRGRSPMCAVWCGVRMAVVCVMVPGEHAHGVRESLQARKSAAPDTLPAFVIERLTQAGEVPPAACLLNVLVGEHEAPFLARERLQAIHRTGATAAAGLALVFAGSVAAFVAARSVSVGRASGHTAATSSFEARDAAGSHDALAQQSQPQMREALQRERVLRASRWQSSQNAAASLAAVLDWLAAARATGDLQVLGVVAHEEWAEVTITRVSADLSKLVHDRGHETNPAQSTAIWHVEARETSNQQMSIRLTKRPGATDAAFAEKAVAAGEANAEATP